MMKYLKIDRDFVDLREIIPNIDTFLIEIIQDGTVKREVGLDKRNVAIHKYPSKDFRHGRYGLFDLASIELPQNAYNDVTMEFFEQCWNS